MWQKEVIFILPQTTVMRQKEVIFIFPQITVMRQKEVTFILTQITKCDEHLVQVRTAVNTDKVEERLRKQLVMKVGRG